MIITGKHLSRRTILRGLGAMVALPALDAMTPALAAMTSGRKAGAPPLRMAFAYVPNGVTMESWTPTLEGKGFEMSRILKPLAPLKDRVLVLSGLEHVNGNPLGDGPGDHARAGAVFLTGVHCRKTAGADIKNGVSVDQIAARHLASQTRLGSLELGCEDTRITGNCDSGYSCAYTNSLAWRSETTPLPPETNPRAVFERLFGADADLDPATRAQRLRSRRSVLDMVSERSQALRNELGGTDKRKLDEYFTAVREVEQRIQQAEADDAEFRPTIEKPSGIPTTFEEHVGLMFDLQVLAFQADLTRVSTTMIAREGSNRTYPEIGVSDPHHPLTHHRNNAEWIEKVTQINEFHMKMFARFIEKLRTTPEGDGSILDHSMIVYGSGIADGNRHTHLDLPVLLVGNGGGALGPGRHIRYEKGTPMTNLYMTMLDRMGVPVESVGDSTGRVQHLANV
jgi:hypothetical protein